MWFLGVMLAKSLSWHFRLHCQNLLTSPVSCGVVVDADCHVLWVATGKGLHLCQGQQFWLSSPRTFTCPAPTGATLAMLWRKLFPTTPFLSLYEVSLTLGLLMKKAVKAWLLANNYVSWDSMLGGHSHLSGKWIHNAEKKRQTLFRVCYVA